MTQKEALDFFIEHEKWLKENWSMSPEGREYAAKFKSAIEAFQRICFRCKKPMQETRPMCDCDPRREKCEK